MPKRTDTFSILTLGAGPIIIGQAGEFDYSGTQAITLPTDLSVPSPSQGSLWYSASPMPSRRKVQSQQAVHRQSLDCARYSPETPKPSRIAALLQGRTAQSGCDGHRSILNSLPGNSVFGGPLAVSVHRTVVLRSQPSPTTTRQRSLSPIVEPLAQAQRGSVRSTRWYRPVSFAQIRNARTAARRDRQVNTGSAHIKQHFANRFSIWRSCGPNRSDQSEPRLRFQRSAISSGAFAQVLMNVVGQFSDGQVTHRRSPMMAMPSMYAMRAH
jgi:hypothetical protein